MLDTFELLIMKTLNFQVFYFHWFTDITALESIPGIAYGLYSVFKIAVNKVPVTVVYTVLGPMVRHYALGYGFHTFPNLL